MLNVEPYVINIARAATANYNYRTVMWTGKYMQMTLMSIPRGGEIGEEVHEKVDQMLRVESGKGKLMIQMYGKREQLDIQIGDAAFIPAGTVHNIKNIGQGALKLSSIYSPPNHPPYLVQRMKEE